MRHPLLVPDLRELIRDGEVAALRDFFADHHPGRIAELIEDLEADDGDALFRILPPRNRAEVFSYLDTDRQVRLVEAMPPKEAAELLHLMSHDERADLVNRLDEEVVDPVLPYLAQAEREDIRRLASYEPGTAGAVMTTDYVTLPPHITVREALERLRHEAPDRETIYYCYVVDHKRRLIGFVSLKKLILSRRSAVIEDIMQRDVIFARVDEDQEAVARQIDKYDLIAMPVVDATGHARRHHHPRRRHGHPPPGADRGHPRLRRRLARRRGRYRPLLAKHRSSTWSGAGSAGCLMLFLAENLTYPVVRYFKWTTDDSHFPAARILHPAHDRHGGQRRQPDRRHHHPRDGSGRDQGTRRLASLAAGVADGLFLGLMLGTAGLLYARYWRGQPWGISAVVGLALLGICMWANTVGALVPLLARRVGIDPAVISAPFISTLVDATGLVIYFTTAIVLLVKMSH